MCYDGIINLFKFKSDECESFDYINDYTVRIDHWLMINKLDNDQQIRYMLIGFFLEYRALNHQGSSFNTIEKSLDYCIDAQKETNKEIFELAKELNIKIEVDDIDVENSILT